VLGFWCGAIILFVTSQSIYAGLVFSIIDARRRAVGGEDLQLDRHDIKAP
jgi:hypothetical protein